MIKPKLSSPPEESQGFNHQLVPLFMLVTVFFLGFFSRVVLAPLMPAIEKDLWIGHGEAGAFIFMMSLGGVIATLGSGFISSVLLHRWTIVLSTVCVGLALFTIALSQGIWGVVTGLFFLGGAAGLYIPSGMATLTELIDPKHWGKAVAIHELAPNVGFVAAPLIAAAMLGHFSWRGVLVAIGIVAITTALVFVKFGKGGRFPGQAPSFLAIRDILRLRDYWIMVVLFSFGVGGTLGIYMMLPLYLIAGHGFEQEFANSLIGISRILGIGMAFLAGWANDRLGAKKTLGMVLAFSGISTILMGASSGFWLLFLVCLQPMIACCFFPPGFAALSSIGPPRSRNVIISFTIPFSFILGAGAIPFLIGVMGDRGSFGLGIIIVGTMIFLGAFLSTFLKFGASFDPE